MRGGKIKLALIPQSKSNVKIDRCFIIESNGCPIYRPLGITMVSKLKILFSNGYFGHCNRLFRNHCLILAAWDGTKVRMDFKNESAFLIFPTATAIPVC